MVLQGSDRVPGRLPLVPFRARAAGGTFPTDAARNTDRGRDTTRAMTFDEIVREHQNAVYGAALRILGDRDAALDAANQAFIKAYRAIGTYDPARPIRPWLLRIAMNEAISIGRSRSRDRGRQAPEADAARLSDPRATPEVDTLEREARDGIRAAVARLPELYRVVVVLRYFNELSLEEVASVTGRSVSTVGVQLLRARQLLRKEIEGTVV